MNTAAYSEAMERALGRVLAETRREFELQAAQGQAVIAELRLHVAELQGQVKAATDAMDARVAERLAEVRNGNDCDMDAVMRRIDDRIAEIPAPVNGKDADPAEIEALRAEIAEVRSLMPEPVTPPDLSGFATKEDLGSIEKIEAAMSEMRTAFDGIKIPVIPSMDHLATKSEVEALKAEIPDLAPFVRTDELPEPKDYAEEIGELRAGIEAVAQAVREIPEIPEMPELPDFPVMVQEAVSVAVDGWGDEVRAKAAEAAAEAVAALPAPENGKDADMDALLAHIDETVKASIPPVDDLRGPPGRLPTVRAWTDVVHYEGAVVTHRGALWQAATDTGRPPPHNDWICLAARGEDGKSPDPRRTYDAEAQYGRLDIVALNGGSFIALSDDPGPCPGDGWQLLAGRGKPGQSIKGDKGDKGEPGTPAAPGAVPIAMDLDDAGLLTMTLDDGSVVSADLRPVLKR